MMINGDRGFSTINNTTTGQKSEDSNVYITELNGGFLKVNMDENQKHPKPIETCKNAANDRDDSVSVSISKYHEPKQLESSLPETVLQYERQRRKTQAAKRASAPLHKSQLLIKYNDENIIVVNKPSGVLTVPGINSNPSLLSLVYEEIIDEIDDNMKMEHMIIHRLDMDTSGIVIFAKDKDSMSNLQASFRDRNVSKTYVALVCGHISLKVDSGSIDLPLQRDHKHPPFMRVATDISEMEARQVVKDLNHAGYKKMIKKKPKPSQTMFRVLRREYVRGKDNEEKIPVTRLELTPITGRTHQLRVHCAAIGHPILGDPAYGIMGEASPNGGFEEKALEKIVPTRASIKLQIRLDKFVKDNDQCMCLHAKTLCIEHPKRREKLVFEHQPSFYKFCIT